MVSDSMSRNIKPSQILFNRRILKFQINKLGDKLHLLKFVEQ